MKQVLIDWFKEEKGGKWSSKKIWGHITMLLVSAAFVLDGLNFYEADHHIFDAMLIAGTTLIGAGTIKEIFKKDGSQAATK
jgi:hypothetical protein